MGNVTIDVDKQETKRKSHYPSFSADVITLIGGTTVAQLIFMVAAPVVARIYGADAFGISALFTSIVGILTVVSCMRYELSIMLPNSDEEAANLLAVSLLMTLFVSLMTTFILWVFGDTITLMFNAIELRPFLWLVPPMVLLSGTFLAINYWNSRTRQFKRLSAAQISKAISTTSTQLGMGITGNVSGGSLIGATLVGQTIATSTLGYQIWKSDKALFKKSICWKSVVGGLKKYRDFPLYDLWSALINNISLQLPIFMLAIFFSSNIVGYYSLGLTVLLLPMTFIGSAVAQVFFQRAVEGKHESDKKLTLVVESTTRRLIAIGFMPILMLTLLGKELFIFVFGSAWAEAGVYAQILSFWILISFVTTPISTLYPIFNKLKIALIINTVVLIARACSLLVGGISGDIYLGLLLFSISGGIIYIAGGYWFLTLSNVSIKRLFGPIYKTLAIGCFLLFILYILKGYVASNSLTIIALAIISIFLYYVVLLMNDEEMKKQLLNVLRRNSI